MQLYQRVKRIAQELAGSEVKMAAQMDMNPRTLNGYLKESREHNLWPLLPKVLHAYPQISREWLYFGEGEMLRGEGAGVMAVARTFRTVAHAPTEVAASDARIRELEQRVTALQTELLAAKDKLISLYEKQSNMVGPLTSQTAPVGSSDNAARSLRITGNDT